MENFGQNQQKIDTCIVWCILITFIVTNRNTCPILSMTSTNIMADVFFNEKCNLLKLAFGRVPFTFQETQISPPKNKYKIMTSNGDVTLEFSDRDPINMVDPARVFGIWHFIRENHHGICVISEQTIGASFEHSYTTRIISVYTNSGKKTEIKTDQFCWFDVAHGILAMMEVLNKFVLVKVFDAFTLKCIFQTPWYKFCVCDLCVDITPEHSDKQRNKCNCQCQCLRKFQNNIVEISDICIVFIEAMKNADNSEWTLVKHYRDQKDFTKTHVNDIIRNSEVCVQDIDLFKARYNILFYANDAVWVDIIDDPEHLMVFDIRHNVIKKVLLPTNHFKPLFDCAYMPITQTYVCFWRYYDTICIVIMYLDFQYFCKEYTVPKTHKLFVHEYVNGYAVMEIDNDNTSLSMIDWIPNDIYG